jgi:uncharacterized membrane protein/CBS domain-containing protein
MNRSIRLLGALGIGAGLMYILDPDKGRRRRAILRDRALKTSNEAAKKINKRSADLKNRFQGAWFETEKIFERQTPTDEKLEAKIRTRLGRLASHPHAIKTTVENGKLNLSGQILADEEALLLRSVAALRGVREIENKLERYESAEHISSLQGENRVRRRILARKTEKWATGARILAAAAGASLVAFGAKKRNGATSLAATAGTALLTRAAVNKPLTNLIRSNGDQLIKVQKAITLAAAPERVFEVLKYPQYFPYFMSHVRFVKPIGARRFFWLVDGVGGLPVEMTTEVTEVVPDKLIRWRVANGSRQGQHGYLRLEDAGGGRTRLHVEMNYRPFAGALGHLAAALFGNDLKSELDEDFLRLKTFIEKGKLPRDAAAIANQKRREEMKVEEIMTKDPAVATLNMSLHEVAQKMAENDCGIIPVVETDGDRKPLGVITDRDLALRTIAHNKNPLNMVAGEVMTDALITVTPEMSVEDCIRAMEKNRLRRVLVVDEAGNLSGIVAQADVARQAPAFETAELVKDVSMSQTTAA